MIGHFLEVRDDVTVTYMFETGSFTPYFHRVTYKIKLSFLCPCVNVSIFFSTLGFIKVYESYIKYVKIASNKLLLFYFLKEIRKE